MTFQRTQREYLDKFRLRSNWLPKIGKKMILSRRYCLITVYEKTTFLFIICVLYKLVILCDHFTGGDLKGLVCILMDEISWKKRASSGVNSLVKDGSLDRREEPWGMVNFHFSWIKCRPITYQEWKYQVEWPLLKSLHVTNAGEDGRKENSPTLLVGM